MIHHGGWCPITLDGDLPPMLGFYGFPKPSWISYVETRRWTLLAAAVQISESVKLMPKWDWVMLTNITGQLHVSTMVMTYNTYDLQLFQSDFLLVWTWSRHHWLRQHPSIDFSGGFHGRGPYSTPFFRHRQAIPSKHDNPANITSIRSDCCPKNELPCAISSCQGSGFNLLLTRAFCFWNLQRANPEPLLFLWEALPTKS
jgi:hypothetical protein